VQVGAAIVATRFVVADVPPLTLAMLRYAVGFLCLAPFVWSGLRAHAAQRPSLPQPHLRKDLVLMALLGMVQFGLLIALLNWGLQHVAAAPAALIFSLLPLLTLLLGAATGSERISGRLVGGVLLSIGGVAVSLAPKLAVPQAGQWWGELAVLAAACVGAACSVAYRPLLQRYPTVPVSAYAMFASVLLLAMLALGEQWPQRVALLDGKVWAVVGFIGLSSGVGYFWWLYALKHESPTRVTVFLALNPVTAAGLGWLLLGEALQAWTLAGLLLIASGLWLATRSYPLKGKRQPGLR
jgi:drug/metabolite transporter (DMT)-like permease